MEQQKTKRQHYVPQFYLKRFCDENELLYLYDKDTDKHRSDKTKNVCFRNNLYELGTLEFEKKIELFQNRIEKIYSENEGVYASAITNILSKLESQINLNALIMTSDEIRCINSFINNLIMRNPYNMKMLLDNENNKNRVVELFEKNGVYSLLMEMFGKDYSHNVDKFIQSVYKEVCLNPDNYDKYGLGYINHINKMSFVFLKSESGKFLTTDFPVRIEVNENGDGFKTFYLPLSPHYAINYFNTKTRDRNRIRILSDEEVIHLNAYCVSDYLNRLVMSNSKENLVDAVEYAKGNKNRK